MARKTDISLPTQAPIFPVLVRRASYWSRAPTPGTRRRSCTRPPWASRAAATAPPATARARYRGAWATSAMGCRHGEVWGSCWCCKDFLPGETRDFGVSEHDFFGRLKIEQLLLYCDSKKEVVNVIYSVGCSRRHVNISKNHCNAQLVEVQVALSSREKGETGTNSCGLEELQMDDAPRNKHLGCSSWMIRSWQNWSDLCGSLSWTGRFAQFPGRKP